MKINLSELIADREAGSRHFSQRLASSERQLEADMRRRKRLLDLEAAYIEAVRALEEIASCIGENRQAAIARKFLGDGE